MTRRTARQADKRIPIALSVLAAVLALLGVHQTALQGASPAGKSVQMASAVVSSRDR